MQLRYPEARHHGVADELLHRAAVPFDDLAHLVEVQCHDAAYRLSVESLPQRGELDHIAEDHRYGLAHLPRCDHLRGTLRQGRTALRAEPGCGRRLLLALRTSGSRLGLRAGS